MSERLKDLADFRLGKSSDDEAAIANEVENRLRTLVALCAYMGWRDVSKHIMLAHTELVRMIQHKKAVADSPAMTASLNDLSAFLEAESAES